MPYAYVGCEEIGVTKKGVYEYLAKCKLGVLGSLGPDNRPQSALVGIAATETLEIVFDTVKSSRKYRNLIASPAWSFPMGWAGEQTVQYEGEAQELAEKNLSGCNQFISISGLSAVRT